MNHLAHALLGAPEPDVILGSLIADFVRGPIDPALRRGVRIGIALHRAVDVYTDAHPETAAARRRFQPPLRRYAGIVLDVWFDHLLANDWSRFVKNESLHAFSRRVRSLLRSHRPELPARMLPFVRFLESNDLPEGYGRIDTVRRVLAGMSARLARANPIADALAPILAMEAPLHAHFDAFWPQLAEHARVTLAELQNDLRFGPPG